MTPAEFLTAFSIGLSFVAIGIFGIYHLRRPSLRVRVIGRELRRVPPQPAAARVEQGPPLEAAVKQPPPLDPAHLHIRLSAIKRMHPNRSVPARHLALLEVPAPQTLCGREPVGVNDCYARLEFRDGVPAMMAHHELNRSTACNNCLQVWAALVDEMDTARDTHADNPKN